MNDVLSQLGEYFDGCATAQQEEALFEAVVQAKFSKCIFVLKFCNLY